MSTLKKPWSDAEEEKPPMLAPQDIIFAISRSWILIAFFGVLGAAVGLVMAAKKPNVYTSDAKLLLRMGARENLTEEDVVAADLRSKQSAKPTIRDEIHLLTDEAIYRKLAREIGPAEILRVEDPRRYDDENTPIWSRYFHELQAHFLVTDEGDEPNERVSAAAKKLLKSTELYSERLSNVILVYHTSTSPEKAKKQCEATVEAFIERHREQFSTAPLAAATKEKLDLARSDLELSQTEFYSHVNECNLINVEERLAALQFDIESTKKELKTAEISRAEIAIEIREKSKLLDTIPKTVNLIVPEAKQTNPDYAAKLARLQQWIVQKETLEFETVGTADEKRRRQERYDSIIAALEEELAGMERFVVDAPERNEDQLNPNWAELDQEIAELGIEDLRLENTMSMLGEDLEEMLTSQTSMVDCRRSHAKLKSDIDNDEQAYRMLSDKFATLDAYATIDEKGDTNLRVLKKASLPLKIAGPNRKKDVLVALMGGMFLGVCLALLRQLVDPRLRYPHAVDRSLGVPVLAVVPERGKLRSLHRRAARGAGTA